MTSLYTLKEATREDDDFLFELYASTREEELKAWGWGPEMASEFLRMQWNAQRYSYAQQFPEARDQILLQGDRPIGRRLVCRTGERFRLIDLALLPECRHRGVGTAVLRDLQREAQQAELPIGLHVAVGNPARRLYERLGFTAIDAADNMYVEMRWTGLQRSGAAEPGK